MHTVEGGGGGEANLDGPTLILKYFVNSKYLFFSAIIYFQYYM